MGIHPGYTSPMSRFLSIRNDPLFRRYFDAVHPFFWPVLYWQLK